MSNLLNAIAKDPTNWYLIRAAKDCGYCLSDLELLVRGALQLKIEDVIYYGLNGNTLEKLQILQKDLRTDGLLVYINSLPNRPEFLSEDA